ncbi:uncharacterized protein C8Q71DRAFT_705274 [Rhodofomes roseus]|uniref:Telomerase reverse transcriptase n=1 Tax=Rhodofomes roseus TaxID=34475 RepID=A0ABQ8KJI7_9APHY|nr:uncharacterized protein C8Q71DRAFT_705274 [Rhodofomes roseus]KAH9838284.1 hypothetical protein C8Q71DRAFT_705274 [Rhodofomes roseus]
MKMHHYLRQWGLNVKKNHAFLRGTIQQMIRYTFATMRNKSSNKVAKRSGGRCDVHQDQVIWLGTHAFYTVLSRKPKTHCQLIKWLKLELSRPRNRRLRKSFRGIAKDGLATLSALAF